MDFAWVGEVRLLFLVLINSRFAPIFASLMNLVIKIGSLSEANIHRANAKMNSASEDINAVLHEDESIISSVNLCGDTDSSQTCLIACI